MVAVRSYGIKMETTHWKEVAELLQQCSEDALLNTKFSGEARDKTADWLLALRYKAEARYAP